MNAFYNAVSRKRDTFIERRTRFRRIKQFNDAQAYEKYNNMKYKVIQIISVFDEHTFEPIGDYKERAQKIVNYGVFTGRLVLSLAALTGGSIANLEALGKQVTSITNGTLKGGSNASVKLYRDVCKHILKVKAFHGTTEGLIWNILGLDRAIAGPEVGTVTDVDKILIKNIIVH